MPQAPLIFTGGEYTNVAETSLRERSPLVVNWMVDEAGTNVSRPGMYDFSTPTPAVLYGYGMVVGSSTAGTYNNYPAIIGLAGYKDWLVAINANRRIFAIDEEGTATDITGSNLLGGHLSPTFYNDNGRLLICGGGSILAWTGTGNVQFHSEGFSPQASHVTVCQGYLVANDAGSDDIFYSSPDNHLEWDPGERAFQAETRNDPCVALTSSKNLLYLFGSETLDIYYPTRVAEPAFTRSHSVERGCAAPSSLLNVDGVIYWLDNHRRICRMDDRFPEVISLEIERTIQEFDTVDDAIAFRLDIAGKHLLCWNFPSADTCFVHDYVLSTGGKNVWYEWRGHASGKWTALDIRSYAYQDTWNKHFCGSFTGGKVRELSCSYGTDAGEKIRRVRRTPYQDHDTTKLKRSNYLVLRAERGTSSVLSSADNPPMVELRFRDQDQRWVDPYHLSLGFIGEADLLGADVRGLGQYRQRQWEISTDADVPELKLLTPIEDVDVMMR